MPGSVAFQNQREFRCSHCSGKILVPKDLPPMTGPCPHCGTTITSPGPGDDKPPVQQVSAKVEVPAVVVKEKVEVPVPAAEPARSPVAPPPLPPAAKPVPASTSQPEPVAVKKPEEPAPVATPASIPPPETKEEAEVPPPPVPVVSAEPVAPVPAREKSLPPPAKEEPSKPVPIAKVEAAEPKVADPAPESRVVVPIGHQDSPPSPKEDLPEPVPQPRVIVPIGLQGSPSFAAEAPVVPAAMEEEVEPVPAPAPPQRVTIPIGLNPVPHPPQEKPPAPGPLSQGEAVAIGLQPGPPPQEELPPASVALPVVSESPAVVPEPVVPAAQPLPVVPVAEVIPPVEITSPPVRQPAPVKISIGLTEEALAATRPAPAPVPAPAAKPAPGPAITPTPTPASAPDYTAAPEVLRERENKAKSKIATDKPRKGILVPMLLLLLLVLGGGGAALFYMTKPMGKGAAKAVPVNPAVQAKIRESQYSQSGWQDEAKQVLGSFLSADGPAGKAAFSIRGSELLPQMNNFYGNGKIDDSDTPLSGFAIANLPPEDHKRGIFRMVYDQPPQFEMREFFRPLAPIEVQFGLKEPDLLLSSLAKASNFSSEPLKVEMFFKRESDGLKVDWETYVQTKYRTFRSFTELADPGRTGIFRLFIVEDVPEKGRASQGTKTYRLADPAHKMDSVRVEVPVDSELGRSFSILNWRGVADARPVTKTVTLELAWTRDASPRLIVSRFICWEFLGIGGQAVGAAAPAGQ